MMAKVLHSIFGSAIVDPRLGFKLKDPHGDITLYLDFHMALADGAAQKLVWSSKGDSGTRYCILCSNVHASRPTTQMKSQMMSIVVPTSITNSNWWQTKTFWIATKDSMLDMALAPRKNLHSGSRPLDLAIPNMHWCWTKTYCPKTLCDQPPNFAMIGCMASCRALLQWWSTTACKPLHKQVLKSTNFWKGITSFGNTQRATNANISIHFSKRRKLKK